jgi:hypothetical protein
MIDPLVLKAGDVLVPFREVEWLDIRSVEEEFVIIHMKNGAFYCASGFDAIEAVMVLKPSALEGKRLKWRKNAWAFHNIVGHPVMQIMAWLGFKRAAIRFHDRTTPRPR